MALRTAVIGGGISGLATAVRLAGQGHAVTLFEGDAALGGLAATFPWRDTHLEKFYHCILPSDVALLKHIDELGLSGDLLWKRTTMGFMYRGRVHRLDSAADLLRFSPLTFLERLRMGVLGLRTRWRGMDPALDAVSAAEWVRGMAGERAFEILWKPMLMAKIGDAYTSLPALWLSSRLSREKTSGPERKGCLRQGYHSLIAAFERRLRERGVALRGGVGDLALDGQGVVSGVLMTRAPVTPHYWMPFVDSGATAQGVIAMSNLVPLERTHGLHVNYFVNYAHRGSELFGRSDADLAGAYRDDLARLFPHAAESLAETHVFRAPFVEPIWPLRYGERRPPSSLIPGRLYLACTAQVYPNVNSWNSCCEVVDAMIPVLLDEAAAAHGVPRRAA